MTAPFAQAHQMPVGAVGTAGNDLNTNIYICPRAGTVTSVSYVPASNITGAATNKRDVSLVNKGTAGSGTTVIATLSFDNGVNATAAVPKTITLSGTAANLVVAAGDVLQWQSTHIATGITDPGGLVSVAIGPNYA